MLLGNDNIFSGRSWEPFVPEKDWTFAAGGDGVVQTLYATFRDAAGNQTTVLSAGFVIDDVPPSSPSLALSGGAEYGAAQNPDYSRDNEVYATLSANNWVEAQVASVRPSAVRAMEFINRSSVNVSACEIIGLKSRGLKMIRTFLSAAFSP